MYYQMSAREAENVSLAFPAIMSRARTLFTGEPRAESIVVCRVVCGVFLPCLTIHRIAFTDLDEGAGSFQGGLRRDSPVALVGRSAIILA